MIRRYGLYGRTSRNFLTYGGRILWHDNKDDLAFLFPIAKNGSTQVREIPPDIPMDQCLPIRDHPDMSWVTWPLTRQQFRNSGGSL